MYVHVLLSPFRLEPLTAHELGPKMVKVTAVAAKAAGLGEEKLAHSFCFTESRLVYIIIYIGIALVRVNIFKTRHETKTKFMTRITLLNNFFLFCFSCKRVKVYVCSAWLIESTREIQGQGRQNIKGCWDR